jgi:hypothetical protein
MGRWVGTASAALAAIVGTGVATAGVVLYIVG